MKKITVFAVTLWLSTMGFAAPLSRSAAKQRAFEFLAGKQLTTGRKALKAAPVKALNDTQQEPYYVFNVGADEGFVIVSGDDSSTPILGYAPVGSFNGDALPDNVKAWLQGYADQIQYMQRNGSKQARAAMAAAERTAITPLVQTHWNQLEPYNLECPEFFDLGRSVAGCVSVAMAQLMYYHRWPAQTLEAIPAYECDRDWADRGRLKVTGVEKGFRLDWNNLVNNYETTEYTSAQEKAVADLMRVSGAAAQMDYANNQNGGSQTSNVKAAEALMRFFGYSKAIQVLQRGNYKYAEWEEIIYKEISEKRPVLYGGKAYGGGHSFVVDGYLDGLFHVNWGWGGYCDGYFALAVMNPGSSEGVGASNSPDGYSMEQEVCIGIKKDEGEASKYRVISTINSADNDKVSSSYWNNRPFAYDLEMGIAYEGADGTWQLIGEPYTAKMEPFTTYSSINFPVYGLGDGTYKIVPVSRVAGTQIWWPNLNVDRQYVEAVVVQGHVTLTLQSAVTVSSLEATNFKFPSKHRALREQKIEVTIRNKGEEFYGPIYLFVAFNSRAQQVGMTGVTLLRGGTLNTSFYFTPSMAGNYTILLSTDDQCSQRIGEATLSVLGPSETGENLTITALTYDNCTDGVVTGPYLSGTITVENKGDKEFEGELQLSLLYNEEQYGMYEFLKQVNVDAYIPAQTTKQVPFKCENLNSGIFYWPQFTVNVYSLRENVQDDIVKFVLDNTAVHGIQADTADDGTWHTVAGQRVLKPVKGLFIHGSKKVVVR